MAELVFKTGAISKINVVATGSIVATSFTGSLSGSVTGNSTSSSYCTSSFNGAKAWAFISQSGTTLTTTAYGCSVTRISLGLYGVKFNTPTTNAGYAAGFSGYSGSAAITSSIGYATGQTTTSFSMSVALTTSPLTRTDFQNGSIMVFGF